MRLINILAKSKSSGDAANSRSPKVNGSPNIVYITTELDSTSTRGDCIGFVVPYRVPGLVERALAHILAEDSIAIVSHAYRRLFSVSMRIVLPMVGS